MSSLPRSSSARAHRINIGLQGGGSHGAFTWGVLDVLLQDTRIDIEGISGTSAGAMNAVALAHGFAKAQGKTALQAREAARESLADFWNGIVSMGALGQAQRAPFDLMFGLAGMDSSPTGPWADAMARAWSGSMSPYQANPLDINPLKDFVERQIDFERLAAFDELKVFVLATKVSTGMAEVFTGQRVTASAVMASACLPMMFQAVEIEGEHYWDGGYSGNPAIHPLIYDCDSRDVLLVQINPIHRAKLPTSAVEIMDRLNEINFNATLIAELRAIDFVKRLLVMGKLDPTHYKDVLLHRIDGGAVLEQLGAATKLSTDAPLINALHDLGQSHARQWLAQSACDLGVRSSINIAQDYLDAPRLPVRPERRSRVG
ncbi:patatin-like phospholipase family protein [Rhodoferax antarcticus]|uniref:Patatin-like phospholipase family protein n=1 Tax=Rhodoferax antarcticus ANT.BR TaxID=1111071 RepID=A0A1Q8YIQ3_9BURK|nr:patatin-like phospholipase family protein [Rhodoferax antarcticus]APW48079.1 patatin [Rhodoferax antarcticus]OLP07934.1 patatin-like phospholipase family protein [Rhodoferax antarcticus ANT.BR]